MKNKQRIDPEWLKLLMDFQASVENVSQENVKADMRFWVPSDAKELQKSLIYYFSHTNEVPPKNLSRVLKLMRYYWEFQGSIKEIESSPRPPFNAEYLLYLLLRKEERDVVIGDLIECYGKIRGRFSKRRADIWFYKQVAGSLLPLLRRALLRIGALVWLGQVLRRLIS
jgi:hypothetical protein